jgi:hypothetical protein
VKLEGRHQREVVQNAKLIQQLQKKINRQDAEILMLQRGDKFELVNQCNRKIDEAVKLRTEVLHLHLRREQELAHSLQRAIEITEAVAQSEDDKVMVEAIEDALTNMKTALGEISQDLHTIKQDPVPDNKNGPSTDNGLHVVTPSEWVHAFSEEREINEKNAKLREMKRVSRGCLVM